MNKKTSIIFFGTPEFAVPALQSLIEADFDIKTVITRPDKPVGRKQVMTAPPVKTVAQENNIPVLQPTKITDEFIEQVKSMAPDLFVIVAYGKILPQALLDIPPKGSVNIHPSLLPKYRGPSPLQATLLSDDNETGVSIMLIDEEMDHGPTLKQIKHPLNHIENYESLGHDLFEIGAEHLPKVIKDYLAGDLSPQEQEHSEATFTKILKKDAGEIDWLQPASNIEKMTRAYDPWPGTYGTFTTRNNEIEAKVIKAKVSTNLSDLDPGMLFKTEEKELAVACGNKTVLIIEEIQPLGKARMQAQAFIAGYLK